MTEYKKYFKDKKITVMGLGLLGRGVGYTKFLAECGALLTVTDLKTSKELATSLVQLKKYKNITYRLGEHKLEDFKNKDMIIKAAGVSLDSIYIKEAKKNKIPIEMDVSLFLKCAPEVTSIGVTGTRGKSMTTMLIYEILSSNKKSLKHNVHIGGNIRGVATLPLLKKVKKGDILVCELDSWQLQGFGEAKTSPHIAVFTSFMPDHMNYYKDNMEKYFADKANIFKFQKKDDTLVIRPGMREWIKGGIKSKLIVAEKNIVKGWKFQVPGEHQQENLACAVLVCKELGLSDNAIKKSVAKFKGMEGRLKYAKSYKGIKIYNDNNATTPEATIAGLQALGTGKNIVLIAGGADKNLDLSAFVKAMYKCCKAVVLLEGSGTDKLLSSKFQVESSKVDSLEDAVKEALKYAKKGDIILFSPAFASFGMFVNEYDRNDQFMKIIKKLK